MKITVVPVKEFTPKAFSLDGMLFSPKRKLSFLLLSFVGEDETFYGFAPNIIAIDVPYFFNPKEALPRLRRAVFDLYANVMGNRSTEIADFYWNVTRESDATRPAKS